MGAIQTYLQKKRKFGGVSDATYNHIDEWLAWYQNSVRKFHIYWIYDGIQSKKVRTVQAWNGQEGVRGLG